MPMSRERGKNTLQAMKQKNKTIHANFLNTRARFYLSLYLAWTEKINK